LKLASISGSHLYLGQTLRKKHGLLVKQGDGENIYNEERWNGRRLHSVKLHSLYFSISVIGIIKK
jgi:hypothetical protein